MKENNEYMTDSEAIEILKRDLHIQIENKALPDGIEAIQIAIRAIEKQIPKKPILMNNMMTKDKFLMCPCCKFRFSDSLVFLKTRCWNCGQKLDWNDE